MPADLSVRNTVIMDTALSSAPSLPVTVGTWTHTTSPNRYTCTGLNPGGGAVSMVSLTQSPNPNYKWHAIQATVNVFTLGSGLVVNAQSPLGVFSEGDLRVTFTVEYLDDPSLVNEEGYYWCLKMAGEFSTGVYIMDFVGNVLTPTVSHVRVSPTELTSLIFNVPVVMTLVSNPQGYLAYADGRLVGRLVFDSSGTPTLFDGYYRAQNHVGLIARDTGFSVSSIKIVRGNASPYQGSTVTLFSDNFDRANGAFSYAGSQTVDSRLDTTVVTSAYTISGNCLAWTQQGGATDHGVTQVIVGLKTTGVDVPPLQPGFDVAAESWSAYGLGGEAEFVYDGGTYRVGMGSGDGNIFATLRVSPTGLRFFDYYKGGASAAVEGVNQWTATINPGDVIRIRQSAQVMPYYQDSRVGRTYTTVFVNGTQRMEHKSTNDFIIYYGLAYVSFFNESGTSTQNKIRSLVVRRVSTDTQAYRIDDANITVPGTSLTTGYASYQHRHMFTGARRLTRTVRV